MLRRPIRLHKNAPTKTPGSAITPRRSCHSAVLRMSSSPLTLTMDEMMVPEKTPFCAMDARACQLAQQDGHKSRSGCFSTHREGDLFFGGKGTASVPFERQDIGKTECGKSRLRRTKSYRLCGDRVSSNPPNRDRRRRRTVSLTTMRRQFRSAISSNSGS